MRALSIIVAGLTVVGAGMGGAGLSHGAERRSKMPDHDFIGEWRTAKGASPAVSIVFHGKANEVTIDGNPVAMTGGILGVKSWQKFFSFERVDMNGKHGGESYTTLGLIAGVLGGRDVLSGFYSEMDYNSEGEDVRGFMAPVVLYKVSPGGTEPPRRK